MTVTLNSQIVSQGNNEGKIIHNNDNNTVLSTFDMGPCVAVCGYNGRSAFMIHSDSQ